MVFPFRTSGISKFCSVKRQVIHLKLIFLIAIIAFNSSCIKTGQIKNHSIDTLVSAQWLNENLYTENLIVIDTTVIVKPDDKGGFRQVSGRDQYLKEHIPRAVFADLLGNLSAKSKFDFVMPTPEKFQKAMGELGVGDDSIVVLYSANNHVWATRLWWMLRWAGFDNAAILDGALNAWKEHGYEVTSEIPNFSKKTLTLNLRPELIAQHDAVLAATSGNDIEIIDAMPSAHYQGLFSMYPRSGHILGATNIPTSGLIDESGYFLPVEELKNRFENYKNNPVITYCGGGVAATSVAFNLFRLGYSNVAVYMGSLNEWTANPDNPMEVSD